MIATGSQPFLYMMPVADLLHFPNFWPQMQSVNSVMFVNIEDLKKDWPELRIVSKLEKTSTKEKENFIADPNMWTSCRYVQAKISTLWDTKNIFLKFSSSASTKYPIQALI